VHRLFHLYSYAERKGECYAKRLCIDFKGGVVGRAPWCKILIVPLPSLLCCLASATV
jgi:hypothetical protein